MSLKSGILPSHYSAGHVGYYHQPRSWRSWRILLRNLRRRLKPLLLLILFMIIVILTLVHRSQYTHSGGRPPSHHDRPDKVTMRTIVGKYVGPNPAWATLTAANLSDEILNTNNYDPDPNSGKMGQPVYLPGYPEDQLKLFYAINRFNLVASDKISVDRKLPDPRKLSCRKLKYDLSKLPNTSVIIVFHNEAWSTLARTVHSILNTSPQHLLAEILLVDDASNRTFLGPSLDSYMNNLSSIRGVDIRIIRSRQRVGLIQARLLGVDEARGEVLTFIDAHCEATQGWLEPLLEQIRHDRRTAACPIIDIINEDTFAYTRSFELHWGAFNWGMNFRWYPISRRELIKSNGNGSQQSNKTTIRMEELVRPFHTPIMAGGLFSIDKSYFEELGRYDPHMDIWGGENIELSLRIWQCGGQLEIVPCSHVAHIFRKSSPYTFRPGKEVADILYTNLARAAEVWIDDWRHFFYTVSPVFSKFTTKSQHENINSTRSNNNDTNVSSLSKDIMVGIEDRKLIRDRLKCQNFQWFLDNIWPEHFFPTKKRFFGNIQVLDAHQKESLCLQRPTVKIGMGQAAVGAVEIQQCQSTGLNNSPQLFVWDKSTEFIMTDESICLDSGSDPVPGRSVILAPCTESIRQKWQYHEARNQLIHKKSELCLHHAHRHNKIQLENCEPNNRGKRWRLVPVDWQNATSA